MNSKTASRNLKPRSRHSRPHNRLEQAKHLSNGYTCIPRLLVERATVGIDLGCGANKTPNFVGMDVRPLRGVDIVHDLTRFPWPLPDECADVLIASHVLEHINPSPFDSRLESLIELLVRKKLLTAAEIKAAIGETSCPPVFLRLMDEAWRVLKPAGRFMISGPYATSPGQSQDPTHCNPMNEITWGYFDPLHRSGLHTIYHPLPWKIEVNTWHLAGNIEVVLSKRRMDPAYGCDRRQEAGVRGQRSGSRSPASVHLPRSQ